jgi:glycine cleavage system transcriptional repressor
MAEDVVVVATGADRPGVMDELSQFLVECGVNIIQSRSVSLGGTYCLLLQVRGAPSAIQSIRMGLPQLTDNGIRAELRPVHDGGSSDAGTFPYIFIASGKDQIGVLHRISHLMRVLKVNIEDMKTRVAADNSFEIRLALAVPRETPVTMLKDYLSYLCKELGIEGELKEA